MVLCEFQKYMIVLDLFISTKMEVENDIDKDNLRGHDIWLFMKQNQNKQQKNNQFGALITFLCFGFNIK